VLLLPGLAVALLIALFSPGPALFTQERVGRHGRRFRIAKFRTMRADAERGGSVTVDGDRRITRLGRILRRLRIDEWPQLWNVLAGHMSLVGPRPDVPGYADRLTGETREILDLRPGLTGPATLYFRNEDRLLARAADPRAYNDRILYPAKVRINLDYARNWSLRRDLAYLLVTVCPPLDRWLNAIPRDVRLADPRELEEGFSRAA
jgi:lipopolysaccharide/colanic/teichoic acid biosynthesis glycosyltransferase